MSTVDVKALQGWIGRTRTQGDIISAAPVAALSASLDHQGPRAHTGEPLPACWHWLYFQEHVPTGQLAVDGHPQRGDFLPPIPLPRRMWAGSRLRFIAPLNVGDEARRISTIANVSYRQGRSGELIFVTVEHHIFRGDALVIQEEQDLVYREPEIGKVAVTPRAVTTTAHWSREITADPVLLFRYSALTFNSHRIHYDRDYAQNAEGYEGLVVQGPLTATLLLDLLYRELPSEVVLTFEFRAIRPLLDGTILQLRGRRTEQAVDLWALNAAGELAMEAKARLLGDY